MRLLVVLLLVGSSTIAGAVKLPLPALDPSRSPEQVLPSHPWLYVLDEPGLVVTVTRGGRTVPVHRDLVRPDLVRLELHVDDGDIAVTTDSAAARFRDTREERIAGWHHVAQTVRYRVSPALAVDTRSRAIEARVRGDRWDDVWIRIDSHAIAYEVIWDDGVSRATTHGDVWLGRAPASEWLGYRVIGFFADGSEHVVFDSTEHPGVHPLPRCGERVLWAALIFALLALAGAPRHHLRRLLVVGLVALAPGEASACPVDFPGNIVDGPDELGPPTWSVLPRHPSVYTRDLPGLWVRATSPVRLEHLPHDVLRIELAIEVGDVEVTLGSTESRDRVVAKYVVSPAQRVVHTTRAVRIDVHGTTWNDVEIALPSDAMYRVIEWSDGMHYPIAGGDVITPDRSSRDRWLDYRIDGWFSDGTHEVLFDSRGRSDARPWPGLPGAAIWFVVPVAVVLGLRRALRSRGADVRDLPG